MTIYIILPEFEHYVKVAVGVLKYHDRMLTSFVNPHRKASAGVYAVDTEKSLFQIVSVYVPKTNV